MTATTPSATLVESQPPPRPTSTIGDVDGRVGEGRERQRRQDLEVRQRHPAVGRRVGVDDGDVGRDLLPRREQALRGDRLPVEADALTGVGEVRRREQAGAQAERPQQRLHHACRRALAVRAGDVDDGVRRLGAAEQVGEGGDPREGRLDPVLRPARLEARPEASEPGDQFVTSASLGVWPGGHTDAVPPHEALLGPEAEGVTDGRRRRGRRVPSRARVLAGVPLPGRQRHRRRPRGGPDDADPLDLALRRGGPRLARPTSSSDGPPPTSSIPDDMPEIGVLVVGPERAGVPGAVPARADALQGRQLEGAAVARSSRPRRRPDWSSGTSSPCRTRPSATTPCGPSPC